MVTETERKTDKWFKGRLEVKQGDEGIVESVVSVFNTLDSDNDVVLPGAFKDGEELPMVWSHDWKNPIGKGVMSVDDTRAVFKGQFFMDTFDGEQAFRKVKNMGSLQEWSWGFRIKGWRMGDFDDDEGTHDDVRFIEDTERFEVSPVLVGANRETETLAIKQASADGKGAIAPHRTPTDAEATWNGPAEVAAMPATASVLRSKHAWLDSDGEADAKSSYKFPHHPADRPHAIRAAVNNAKHEATALFMWLDYLEANFDDDTVTGIKARLPQANIPAGDRAGVLRHLNGHFNTASHEPSDGKQSGEWSKLADAQLLEAVRAETARAGVKP